MTLILTLGHDGDDGVGEAVLAYLATTALPTEVSLLDACQPGLETAFLLRDNPDVIIIDTADMGLLPGTWRRFTPEALPPARVGSLHYGTLVEALALAAALGRMPADITIYGVQPDPQHTEPGLSPLVQAAVPALTWAIWQQVTRASEPTLAYTE